MRALTNATLIDGTGRDPAARSTVLVGEDGRITRVGRIRSIPRGTDVIDVAGRTVMPGLIDCHVHLMVDLKPLQERVLTPLSLLVLEGAAHARATLEAGVTSIRDAGGTPVGLKIAAEKGLIPSPRMKIAVVILSQTGGHGDSTMPSGLRPGLGRPSGVELPEWPENICDGIDGVRKAVRSVMRAGADFIKLCSSGGVLSPSDEPGAPQFSPDEIAVMVQEARAHGKSCMAHAQGLEGIKNAVDAGVESIEHGIFLDEATASSMKERGTFLVPTLQAPLGVWRRAESQPGSILPQSLRKTKEVIEVHRRNVRMAIEMGVKVAMGTDAGVWKHGENAEELKLLVEAGMTPMQAIVAATKTASECAHVAENVGVLEAGKLADLVVVDGDPLADITVLQDKTKLLLIMQGGKDRKNLVDG